MGTHKVEFSTNYDFKNNQSHKLIGKEILDMLKKSKLRKYKLKFEDFSHHKEIKNVFLLNFDDEILMSSEVSLLELGTFDFVIHRDCR